MPGLAHQLRRQWLHHYSHGGGPEFGEIDVDPYEIDAQMGFDSPADALKHAHAAIDRWWDDRDVEAVEAAGDQ